MDRSVLEFVPDAVIWIGMLSSTAYCLAMLRSALKEAPPLRSKGEAAAALPARD